MLFASTDLQSGQFLVVILLIYSHLVIRFKQNDILNEFYVSFSVIMYLLCHLESEGTYYYLGIYNLVHL